MCIRDRVKSICRCTCVEKRAKNMLPEVGSAGPIWRLWRIPRLAALMHGPFDANLMELWNWHGQAVRRSVRNLLLPYQLRIVHYKKAFEIAMRKLL